jgi:hypothetical protein
MPNGHVEAPAWAHLWRESIRHSLPMLVWLALATTIVAHVWKPDFGLGQWLIHRVAWSLYDIHAIQPAAGEPFAVVATMRPEDVWEGFASLRRPAPETLSRLGDAWPLDRLRLAAALKRLAAELPPRPDSVLALDFDVAPLESGGSSCTAGASPRQQGEAIAMVEALDALRARFGAVIAIALPRASCAERAVRRRFLTAARCSSPDVRNNYPDLAPLYLASSRLELDANGEVSTFLGNRTGGAGALPVQFPSLGALLRLATESPGPPAPAIRDVLESQCVAATQAGSSATLTEESIDWEVGSGNYQLELIDLGGIANGQIRRSALELAPAVAAAATWGDAAAPSGDAPEGGPLEADALGPGPRQDPPTPWWQHPEGGATARAPAHIDALSLERPAARRIILAFGGAPGDQHRTPAFLSIEGALLHAAVAYSERPAPTLEVVAFGVDLLAGLLFLAAWAALDTRLRGAARPLRLSWPALLGPHPWRRRALPVVVRRLQRCRRTLAHGAARAALFAAITASVAAAAVAFAAWRFALSTAQLKTVFGVAPWFAATLSCASLLSGAVVATLADGLAFGQRAHGVAAAMPWLRAALLRSYPVCAAFLVGSGALLFALDSLMNHHFHDVTLVLLGLTMHSYLEIAHLHAVHGQGAVHAGAPPPAPSPSPAQTLTPTPHPAPHHTQRLRVRLAHSAHVIVHGARHPRSALHRLDAILHATAWTAIGAYGLYAMFHT